MPTKIGLLLAIDIGTTNLKVAAFTGDGICVGLKKTATITHYDAHGNSYYRTQEIWGAITGLLQELTSSLNEPILAISATSMAEALVPIDQAGHEIYDIITWFDTRAGQEAAEIIQKIGRDRLFQITGLDPNPIFPICKMLWMKRNHPSVFERAVKWLQMTDYMMFKLAGALATDYTLATRTLAFDVIKNDWSDEILDAVAFSRTLFPPIVESGTVVGIVNEAASAQTGIPAGVPVVMGGNDHPCAGLAAGVLNGNRILDSSGTAESFLYVSSKNQTPIMQPKGQRTCRYLDKERFALWGGIISSGASFEWAYQTLTSVEVWGLTQNQPEYSQILEQVSEVPPGSNGVMFLPHLRGSGAPYWDPRMTGAFIGLKSTTTQQALLRSVMEGLAFQARMIVEMHEAISGTTVEALCVVGGSSKNLLWQQIKADVLQKPLEISKEPEATLLGAALLAGVGVQLFEDMTQASIKVSRGNHRLLPDPEHQDIYQDLYEIYLEACQVTQRLSHRLSLN